VQVPKALDPEAMAQMRAGMEAAMKQQLLAGRLSCMGGGSDGPGGGGGGLRAELSRQEVDKVWGEGWGNYSCACACAAVARRGGATGRL
jgi:hypothetical protein